MTDEFLQLLGLARRAGRLSMGHDMAMESIMKGQSFLVIIASSSSERLKNEFIRAAQAKGGKPPVLPVPYTIDVIHKAVGYKAGVLSVNDAGFAARFIQMLSVKEEIDT